SPADRARRLLGAARAEFWSGDATKARELAEEGLQLADDPLLHADLMAQVETIAGIAGPPLSEAVLFQELDRVRELDTERSANFALEYMQLEWWSEVRSALAETLREGRASGNLLRIVWNQGCTAFLELRHGRLTAAELAAAEAIPLGEALGVPVWTGYASIAL